MGGPSGAVAVKLETRNYNLLAPQSEWGQQVQVEVEEQVELELEVQVGVAVKVKVQVQAQLAVPVGRNLLAH